jgi:hypothetical protein
MRLIKSKVRNIIFVLVLFFTNVVVGQNFTYSGYIYNSNGVGASNVPVRLYKRTTPSLNGFTSQTNYNGHSYYRSTGSMFWLDAKTACENMNGHLATISDVSERNFLFNTWPSGWIGYYQDKTGPFFSEPLGGWRWTENYVTATQTNNYDVSSYSSGSVLTDLKNSKNITLYNSPVLTTGGGKYLTFNGVNTYGITPSLTSHFTNSNVITLVLWVYPTGNGVILSELGIPSPSSGWHESVVEITGGNTLRCGFWNGTGITQISTSITLNQWCMIALTYNGSTMTGYRNGVSFGSTTFSRFSPHLNGGGDQIFALGLTDATNMGHGGYGSFRLGAFQVYNTSLTSDEINRNYMSLSYRFGINPYLSWNGGEPNNSGTEDYAQFVGGGLWNDLPNNVSLPYVLEFDYIVTFTPWVLFKTVYTDFTGKYTINESTNPSVEWYIQLDAPTTITGLQNIDAIAASTKAISRSFTSLDYYKYDVNNDGNITVSDEYYIFMKKNGRFSSWGPSLPSVRLFTSSQFSIINSSTNDLRSTYPGVQSITISTPTNGGSSNYYLINTGYSNSTILGY